MVRMLCAPTTPSAAALWSPEPSRLLPGALSQEQQKPSVSGASRLPGAWSLVPVPLRQEARSCQGPGTVHSLHTQLWGCGPFSAAEQHGGAPGLKQVKRKTLRKTNVTLCPFSF